MGWGNLVVEEEVDVVPQGGWWVPLATGWDTHTQTHTHTHTLVKQQVLWFF